MPVKMPVLLCFFKRTRTYYMYIPSCLNETVNHFW